MGAILSLREVSRDFVRRGRVVQAMAGLSLDVAAGEFVTVVGPSGCGKSTLLNVIAGLLPPSGGEALYQGAPVRGVNAAIGYVTQADNLYPWRTLRENVEFPLEVRGVARAERRRRAAEVIERVGLGGFEDHYPYELSGGMRQRANIVRTLVYDPEVILMDEPFGPLDAQTRLILQDQLLRLWDAARKTIIFITHDLTEAVALADRVVVMTARPGRVKRVCPVPLERPRDLFHLHDDERFRVTYDTLWDDLAVEVRQASDLSSRGGGDGAHRAGGPVADERR
jgi:NitT/TauT family transport system ATP-binding protein